MRRAVGTMAAGALASLAFVAPAAASYPGENGLISWSTSRGYSDGSSAIWGKYPFGGEPRRLTSHRNSVSGGTPSDSDASWEADGRRFVFTRGFGIGPRLFVKTLGESRAHMIPLGDMAAEQPAFAPDGHRVAFVKVGPSDDPLGRGPLSVMVARVDGTHVRRLAAGEGPVWTPDGRRIVFQGTRDGRTRLISIRPDGSHKHAFAKRCAGAGDPSFAPDGRSMATVYSPHQGGPYRIWTMGLSCRHKRQITFSRPTLTPAWSPDGRWIAYFAPSRRHRRGGLYVVRPDGTGQRLVGDEDGSYDLDWQPRP